MMGLTSFLGVVVRDNIDKINFLDLNSDISMDLSLIARIEAVLPQTKIQKYDNLDLFRRSMNIY